MPPSHRDKRANDPDRSGSATPTDEDESDIVEEAGAERDPDTGQLLVDEDTVRRLGALDAASIRQNRSNKKIVDKKRAGKTGIPFNTDDPIVIYDMLLRVWPVEAIEIVMKRLTGANVTHVIKSLPRNGLELYEAFKVHHGVYGEAEYMVTFRDSGLKELRGTGRIVMPDTTRGQQGQPMQQPYYPPPQQAPQAQPGATSAPQQPPPPPPVVVHTPPGMDMGAMLEAFQRMSELFRSWQPPPQQTPAAPPQYPYMPPPPQTADPSQMIAWMQQMADIVRSMQPPAPRGGAPQMPYQYPAQAAPAAPPMRAPAMPAPPGTMWVYAQDSGWIAMPVAGAGPSQSGPYRGPGGYRPPYYPQREPGDTPMHAPPPRPQSAIDQLRDSLSYVRTAVAAVQDLHEMIPGIQPQAAEAATPEVDDDSPIQIIDTGPAKIVVNKEDGKLRPWETGWANLDKVFKWVGEQHEILQKAHANAAKAPPQKALPPGYIEVPADYQPPPGYTAVQVDPNQIQASGPQFTPPPAEVPPPIQPATAQRTWGVPTIPGRG